MKKHDVIIIGGGPAGSTLLSYLTMKGIDAAVVERETFPRFHIGESLLPHSMDIFREIGVYDKLDSGRYIQKFGAQFVHYDEEGEVYFDFETGLDNLHPMAFEVPRDQFDKDLLDHAQSLGGKVYMPATVRDVQLSADGAKVVTSRGDFEARYVIDASGRSAFLGKRYKMRHPNHDLNNVGVFAHFIGVERNPGKREGDISIGLLPELKWCWLIPFLGERTSIGVVCSAKNLDREAGFDTYIEDAVRACPGLRDRMASAERVTEVGVIANYSHTCEQMVGDRWMLIGDAAAFLDPIFSSGVHVGITSAKLASEAISQALAAGVPLTANGIKEQYEKRLMTGVHRFHRLIRLFYDNNFVRQMKKTFQLKNMRAGFTSIVAGDAWNDDNFIFRTGAL